MTGNATFHAARPEEDLIDYAPGKMNPVKDLRVVARASFQPGIAFEIQET